MDRQRIDSGQLLPSGTKTGRGVMTLWVGDKRVERQESNSFLGTHFLKLDTLKVGADQTHLDHHGPPTTP